MKLPSVSHSILPTGGAGPAAQVCHGEITSAAYAARYTLPPAETLIAGKRVSTRRGFAGALSVLPSGLVAGYPIGVCVEAFCVGNATAGADQVAPPSLDLLYSAVAWQPALVRAGHNPPVASLMSDDQVT